MLKHSDYTNVCFLFDFFFIAKKRRKTFQNEHHILRICSIQSKMINKARFIFFVQKNRPFQLRVHVQGADVHEHRPYFSFFPPIDLIQLKNMVYDLLRLNKH